MSIRVIGCRSFRIQVDSHTSRFAYKSIRIQVDSHTSRFAYIEVVSPTRPWSIRIRLQFESPTLKSIRIHNLSRFAYKKVIRLRIQVRSYFVYGEHHSRRLTTRATNFFLNITRVDTKWSSNSSKRKQVSASVIHFKLELNGFLTCVNEFSVLLAKS